MVLAGYSEKRRQSLYPLLKQLLPVNEDQGVDTALRDEPRRQHCFAKSGCGRKDAGVMRQHCLCR